MEATLQKLYDNYKDKDLSMVLHAYDFAKNAHASQKRASGEPYFVHPCAVAEILIGLRLDAPTIAAALLHDVIEDTPYTDEDIHREFGDEILRLVQGVTKLDGIPYKKREDVEIENIRKLFFAMAKDIRVIFIKLADRLHNMRSLNFLSQERQRRMANETMEIFAPLAGRLGISQIKCELEDLCLKYLDPEAFEFLVENINQKLYERQQFVDSIVEEINGLLEEAGIQGRVFGRPKHFYSIYKKMKKQNKTLEQIYDLSAVRVIVDSIEDCYVVFGIIERHWTPIPGRIKDYIANPKINRYQSLHTTVATKYGQPFEIQIRTEQMHRIAEYGICAHWKYKEDVSEDSEFSSTLMNIRQIMEIERDLKNSDEFLNLLKEDLYNAELLVFTPKGQLISLPNNSTPIDFAYAIHSEVGNQCVGAKVNGKIAQLNSILELGDVVEITTSASSKGPSWDWLRFVRTNNAKAKIRAFFKHAMRNENEKLGRERLEEEARHKGYELSTILTDENFANLSEKMSFSNRSEMFASIGYGAVNVNQVLYKLIDFYRKTVPKPVVSSGTVPKAPEDSVIFLDMPGRMLTRFAGCCNPVPGDEIIGFVSKGRGVVVHRKDCPNIKNAEPERLHVGEWKNIARATYVIGLEIRANDEDGVLAFVCSVIGDMKLNVTQINGRVDKAKRIGIINVNVLLNDTNDIDMLIKRLRQDKRIIDAYRTAPV